MEIGFLNLKVPCIIGVLDFERHHEQILEADISIETDVSEAVTTDDVSLTIAYDELARLFADHCRQGKFLLLETLVSEFHTLVETRYPQVTGGNIEVRKPGAIPLADAAVVRLKW